MSLKTNTIANYISQIYVTLAGIIMLPVYLKYMGSEAYGLVGFFTMLQAWFGLLDIGLSPTVAREAARTRAGAVTAIDFRRLVRSLTTIFVFVALIGSAALFAMAPFIADKWLHADRLSSVEVRNSIQLMSLGIGLRWVSVLARARITGAEAFIWLSSFNATITTIRFIGIIPIFILINPKPATFFAFQLFVIFVELLVLKIKAHSLLPKIMPTDQIGWSLRPVLRILKFSLGIAFTSSVWILVTQTDKLILSKLLSLQNYGYYSLAVVIAGSVLIATGPISMVLIPRLTHLAAERKNTVLLEIYGRSTRKVGVIAAPVAFVLAAFAMPVVWAWTGDIEAAQEIAPTLQLYAIGNAILAISAFPGYLQYAYGDLRLHIIGSTFFILFLIPALIAGVWKFGAIGAGWAWLGTNVCYFIFWIPIVHKKFAPGTHLQWLGLNALQPIIFACAGAMLASYWIDTSHWSRLESGVIPLCAGFVVLVFTALPLLWTELPMSEKLRPA